MIVEDEMLQDGPKEARPADLVSSAEKSEEIS